MKRIIYPVLLLLPALACALLSVPGTRAAGANQWKATPVDGDWNNAANWTANFVPNSANTIATFASSNITAVSLSANTEVAGITFNAGASAFTITPLALRILTISGVGIVNNSGITQRFVAGVNANGNSGFIVFSNSASAGSATNFASHGNGNSGGGAIQFHDLSNAGSATLDNSFGNTSFSNGSSAGSATITNDNGNGVFLNDNSTAGNATITNIATNSDFPGGLTSFYGNANAGTATIIANGGDIGSGGSIEFSNTSSANGALLIANGGTNGGAGGVIVLGGDSSGGTSRVQVSGNGSLDISTHNTPGVSVGSLEGTGAVFLGSNNLTIGTNNLSTTFSGVSQDAGQNPAIGGALTKVGSGTLTLTNRNTYSGGTLINAGTLIAAHDGALGSGSVSLAASSVTLTLQTGATNNYIADTASLSIVSGSTVNLNFTGTPDTIGSLIVDGTPQAAGLYGSAASGAPHQLPEFSGLGEVVVTTIPEPSPLVMMLGGAGILLPCQHFRRRRWRRITR